MTSQSPSPLSWRRLIYGSGMGIKRPILLSIAGSLLFLIGVILFSLFLIDKQQEELSFAAILQQVENDFKKEIAESAALMEGMLMSLERAEDLRNHFQAGDRDGLLLDTKAFFEFIRGRFNISHLYFFDAQRVPFLRVHKPDTWGGAAVSHHTLLKAQATGQKNYGLELGTRGTLTLRVTIPWHHEGEIIGYLEMGKESNRFFADLHQIENTTFFTFIYKSELKQARWWQTSTIPGTQEAWDRFPSLVYSGSHEGTEFPPGLEEYIRSNKWDDRDLKATVLSTVDANSNHFHFFAVPIYDLRGHLVGRLVGLHDYTDLHTSTMRQALTITLTAFLTGTLLFLFLYRILSRIESEQRSSQEAIQNLHRHNELLLLAVNDGLIGVDLEGRITFANTAVVRMLGLSKTLMIGKRCANLLLPREEKESLAQEIKAKIERPDDLTPHSPPWRYCQRNNGTLFPCEIALNPIRDQEGCTGLVLVLRDVSESIQAEQTLRESEEKFRTLLEQAADAVFAHDVRGRFVQVNQKACASLGYTREELLQLTVADIESGFPGEAMLDLMEQWRNLPPGAVNTRTGLHRRKDGTVFPVEVNLAATESSQGRLFMALARDITQRQQTEQQMLKAKEAAEGANKAKSSFLANMSHEIRSPMNAVIGMTSLLLNTPLGAEQRQYMEIVQQSAESLLDLLNRILDYSKIEAGRMVLEKSRFSLRGVIEDACRTLAESAGKKGLELNHRIAPTIPAQVLGDPLRIRQILLNLIGNAIKFTRKGTISVTAAPLENGRFTFSITDTGIGIEPDKQELIFGYFTQADDSTTRKFGGTGLGLAITKQFVEMMGGRIWVESAVGKGSCFRFIVHLEPVEVEIGTVKDSPLHGIRVMLADNQGESRSILVEMLREQGATVSVASTGEQAMLLLKDAHHAGRPMDVALFDCRLPDQPGFLFAKMIQENPACHCALITLLPPNHRQSDPEDFRKLGVSATLLKPVKQEHLLSAILTAAGRQAKPVSVVAPKQVVLKILAAEDQQVGRQLLEAILKGAGHTVQTVADGESIFNSLAKERFDLLLLDLRMPGHNGLEVAQVIRSGTVANTPADQPIMAVSADVSSETKEACKAAGIAWFVSKPYRPKLLLEQIDALASEKEAARFFHARQTRDALPDEMATLQPFDPNNRAMSERRAEFPEEAVAIMSTIVTTMTEWEQPVLERSAQELKTIANVIGANRLKNCAMKLLLAIRNNDQTTARQHLPCVEHEVGAVLEQLREVSPVNSNPSEEGAAKSTPSPEEQS